MKILLQSMNFAPELAGVGKYSGEMARWLSAQGHEVRVIAAPPFFPHWAVFAGHSAWSYRRTAWHGVSVWRIPTWVPARPRALARLAHQLSFMLASLPVLLAQVRWRPDIVLLVEPALICAPAALLFARALRIKSWLHIQDHEVDAAFGLGLMRGGRLQRAARAVERGLLARFHRVSTISTAMLDLTRTKGVAAARLVLVPNGVDLAGIQPQPPREAGAANPPGGYRASLGIAADAVVVMYAGSMGHKQGIELLAEAAALLADAADVHFVFCGNGPSRSALVRGCAGLPQVHFLDLQPASRLGELLATADIHVLVQRADAADLVMPSKLGGMFASGRAVIVTAHGDTELARAVEGRGMRVPPGDAAALAQAIAQLASTRTRREALGAAGRAYAETQLDQEVILRRLEQELARCVAELERPPT